jgi:hypothetical protein
MRTSRPPKVSAWARPALLLRVRPWRTLTLRGLLVFNVPQARKIVVTTYALDKLERHHGVDLQARDGSTDA